MPTVGQDDVGRIPVEPAFLLVYAAEGNGQIFRLATLGSAVQVSTDGKQFMADNSQRESARWQEALDLLITWGWVKPVGRKGEVYEVTGTGYTKADWLKDDMCIDISKEPLEELKQFEFLKGKRLSTMPRTKGSKDRPKTTNDYASQITEKQEQIATLNSEIKLIQKEIEEQKNTLRTKKAVLKKAERELSKLEAKKAAADQKATEEAKKAEAEDVLKNCWPAA